MAYREIPKCPEPSYVPEMSVGEELKRFNRDQRIITVTSLVIQLLVLLYVIVTRC